MSVLLPQTKHFAIEYLQKRDKMINFASRNKHCTTNKCVFVSHQKDSGMAKSKKVVNRNNTLRQHQD